MSTERVYAVGDSAGAHLLGLYAAICTNPAYAAKYDFAVHRGVFAPLLAIAFELQVCAGSKGKGQTI
ncbi:MAG: hypothetical protein ACLU4P_04745 [Ruminococcus sp.]